MTLSDIQEEIVADLTILMKSDPNFQPDALYIKVKNAIKEVKMRRAYENTSWSEDKIVNDLYNNYYSVISAIATHDYNQLGAEGESQHSEGGDTRHWRDREKYFNGVHAFVNVLTKK